MLQDLWSLSGGTYAAEAAWPTSAIFGDLRGTKNKKPGVERRAQPRRFRGSTRSSTRIYPVLVRNLTLGSGYCPTDPTVTPLIDPPDLAIRRTICDYTETSEYVKPLSKLFFRAISSGCGKGGNPVCGRATESLGGLLVLWRRVVLLERLRRPGRHHAYRPRVGDRLA